MGYQTVSSYQIQYNLTDNQFHFLYKAEGSRLMRISVSPEVCMALADMFRNEGPVKYNTDNNTFSTGPEPIGEGEPVQP